MKRNIRLAGVHIALAVMLMRALLPAGWMPNPTASADSPFVICTMDGPVQAVLGPDGQPLKQQPDQNNDRGHEVCPFAAAPHLAAPTLASALAPPSSVELTMPTAAYLASAESLARYTPQSPRAPPSFV